MCDIQNQGTPLWFSSRLALTFIGFFGFVNLYALRVDMSVAIVCMTTQDHVTTNTTCPSRNVTNRNDSEPCPENAGTHDNHNTFDWGKETQGLILGSFFWGYTITQIPGGWISGKYGGKRVFGWSMFVCALATILTPLAARAGVIALIVCRVIAGLAQGVVWPAMHTLLAHWVPPLERSKLSGFVYAGCQIGNVVTFPISGLLCAYGFDGGWPSIFYIFGGIGMLWFGCWMLIVADTPVHHPRIDEDEKHYIVTSLKGDIDVSMKTTYTPWVDIFTSLPVWAIIVTHACSNWGTYTFLTNIPSYMKEVLQYDMKKAGFLTALPYIGFWAMTNVSGQMADFLRRNGYTSTTGARKIFNTLGTMVPAVFIVVTGHMDSHPWVAVVLLTVGVAMSGCQYGSGFIVNPVDVAPRYAGIIFGISNTTGTIGGFMAPIVIGIITSDRTREQWQTVFYIAATIYTAGALFYVLFGSGEIQEWATRAERPLHPPPYEEAVPAGESGVDKEPARDTTKL